MSELPENWREELPDDMKSNGILDTVKSMESLVKMAIDGRTLATNSVRIPSVDASDEARTEFQNNIIAKVPTLMMKPDEDNVEGFKDIMKTFGLPADVSGYDLPDIPEAIQSNIDTLKESALDAGLTQKQLSAITTGIVDDFTANTESANGKIEQQRSELKKEWGEAYDDKVRVISHFAKQTGFSDDFVEAINEGYIDAVNMKAFDGVVHNYEGEALEIGRQAGNPDVKMTPAEAESRLNELMGNKEHAFWHPENPEHEAAKNKVLELGRIAETGEQTESEKFRASLMGG